MKPTSSLGSLRRIRQLREQAKLTAEIAQWTIQRNEILERGFTLRQALGQLQTEVKQRIHDKPPDQPESPVGLEPIHQAQRKTTTSVPLMKALAFPRTHSGPAASSNPWFIPAWLWSRMSVENRDKFVWYRRRNQTCLVLLTDPAPVVPPRFRVKITRNGTSQVVDYPSSERDLHRVLSLYSGSNPRVERYNPSTKRWMTSATAL